MKLSKHAALSGILTVLLASSCILASCGDKPTAPVGSGDGTAADTAASTEEPVVPELTYSYDIPDLGEDTFTFLNCEDTLWSGSFHVIDYEAESGDIIENAVFQRARAAEDALNMHLAVEKTGYDNLQKKVSTSVMSADDMFQAAYLPLNRGASIALAGEYALNLYDVDSIHLSDPWWNQSFINQATILDDKLYATIDYINIMGYTYSNVIYFNRGICEQLDLELPYDAVRRGKWTYDMMIRYMSEAANLNGDSEFVCKMSGNCVFGYAVQHSEGTMTVLNGCGSFLVNKDKDGIPQLNPDNSRLQSAFEKLLGAFSEKGLCIMQNGNLTGNPDGGVTMFANGRSLFYQGPLGISAADFRPLDIEYGVIPAPKLDEAQDTYYTMVSQYTLALMLPKSLQDPERSGAVVDYMSFLGYKNVIPEVQTALCYKGLRDEDSIEMFNTMLNTVSVDLGYLFGWSSSLTDKISNNVYNGTNDFMSQFEANRDKITAAIDKTLAQMRGEE